MASQTGGCPLKGVAQMLIFFKVYQGVNVLLTNKLKLD